MSYFAGVDVGASTTKAVILDKNKDVLGYAVRHSGADFEAAAKHVFEESKKKVQGQIANRHAVVATGYGRRMLLLPTELEQKSAAMPREAIFTFPTLTP